MKNFNKKFIAITTLLLLALTSCNGSMVQINHSRFENSSGQIDLKKVDFTRGREIFAESSGFQLLLFIPIGINERHQNAFHNLQSQAGSDFLTNIRVQESWTYAFVGTIYKTKLQATVYPYKK